MLARAAGEGGGEAGARRLLDLGAAEAVGGGGEAREVEELRVALPLAEMDREDLLALVGVGEIHEEDLVEAALARQLGRQLSDVIALAHTEAGPLPLLHPPAH